MQTTVENTFLDTNSYKNLVNTKLYGVFSHNSFDMAIRAVISFLQKNGLVKLKKVFFKLCKQDHSEEGGRGCG